MNHFFAFRGFFNLDPRAFKICAGEKFELTVTGCSHKVTTIKEMWYLIGSVEGINKKELLLECPIIAEFVDPKIEVSSSVVELQCDFGPYSELYKLTGVKHYNQILIAKRKLFWYLIVLTCILILRFLIIFLSIFQHTCEESLNSIL